MSKPEYLETVSECLRLDAQPLDVLEAGVGAGITGAAIAAMLRSDDTLHAVDLIEANVTGLAERLRGTSDVACRLGIFAKCDVRDLQSFADQSMDVVCADTMLAQLGADLDLALGEFLRVLKPAGWLIVREYCPPEPGAGRGRDLLLQVVLAARALRNEPYLMLPGRLVARVAIGVGFDSVEHQDFAGEMTHTDLREWFPLSDPETPLHRALSDYFEGRLADTQTGGALNDAFVLTARKPFTSDLR